MGVVCLDKENEGERERDIGDYGFGEVEEVREILVVMGLNKEIERLDVREID